MPITSVTGDFLAANTAALVNPVNCAGVMGKGLALAFKQRWPDNFRSYRAACEARQLRPGRVHLHDRGPAAAADLPRFIINFPTKDHWRSPSRLEWIQQGLADLVQVITTRAIPSIAIPPLGCGLGGLPWTDVRPLIEEAFHPIARNVEVRLYEPAP